MENPLRHVARAARLGLAGLRKRLGELAPGVVVPLGAALVGLALVVTGTGGSLDGALQSLRDNIHRHSASDRFVLVEIDAKSLQELDSWPWPRSLYAAAIRQLERASVSTIAFDVDFSAHSTAAQDNAFAKAIDTSRAPVILPTFRQYGSLSDRELIDSIPIPPLRRNAQLAAVNISADGDGLVRRYPYGVITKGVPRPSIAAMLSGVDGRAGNTFPIDGSIDPASIPRISFHDLVSGQVPAGSLRGKSVLIGATAIELGDRYSVPQYGVIPGPVVQLLATETLRSGSSPIARGPLVPLALAVLALMLLAKKRQTIFALGAATAMAAILALPLLTELAHLGTFAIVPAMAAMLVGVASKFAMAFLAALADAQLIDPVSKLPNRRGLQKMTAGKPTDAVVILRISNFSDAASIVGQSGAGDLIKRVIDRLAIAGATNLFRLEEGVIACMPVGIRHADLRDHIEGFVQMMHAPVEVAGRRVELRCCFGYALDHAQSADILADRAMLAAERANASGGRIAIYRDELVAEADWQLQLAGELGRAIEEGHLWVAYQPKFEYAQRQVTCAEALVRWNHPDRGPIVPDDFIPALEESDRIFDLTNFVIETAVRDMARWLEAGIAMNVAVNVSARLAADPRILKTIDLLIEAGILRPSTLTLEVTESAEIANSNAAMEALDRIAERGIRIAIDDYGTGQSTLSYLKTLPATELKIDKSFVLSLEFDDRDKALVRSTINLAHELGYKVVAEGVENERCLNILEELGCDYAQGWYIGKPMPFDAFGNLFQRKNIAA